MRAGRENAGCSQIQAHLYAAARWIAAGDLSAEGRDRLIE
jgi:hypothetical protein